MSDFIDTMSVAEARLSIESIRAESVGLLLQENGMEAYGKAKEQIVQLEDHIERLEAEDLLDDLDLDF